MDISSIVGTTIEDRYQILSIAGSGGMGTVYKARQVELERFVAVKVLSQSPMADPETAERFEREAKAISILKHQHIATFYAYGILDNSLPYIIMEFLDGQSLNKLVNSALDWRRSVKICRQICQAMTYAHEQGILHRDLKPENIILCNSPESDFVKVVDFGLAKLSNGDESVAQRLTRTGELIGSVHYLSPEQCLGQRADKRSDIYSLGCVLYQMLCAEPPFDSDNPIAMLHKHANEKVIPPTIRGSRQIPEGLSEVVLRALEKRPEDRYQSMLEFEQDLKLIELERDDELTTRNSKTEAKTNRQNIIANPIFLLILICSTATLITYFYLSSGGQYAIAHKELSSNPSRARLLYWLEESFNMAKTDLPSSIKIRTEVESAVRRESRNAPAVARLYLELADNYLKKGKQEQATKAAKSALLSLVKVNLNLGKKHNFAYEEYESLVGESAELCLQGNVEFTNTQERELLLLSRRIQLDYAEKPILPLLELVVKYCKKNKIADHEEMIDAMIARDASLALKGKVQRLAQTSVETEQAIKTYYAANTQRLPFYFNHLSFCCLDGKGFADPNASLTYANKSLAYLQKTTGNDALITNAFHWYQAAENYEKLGQYDKALRCAKTFLTATKLMEEQIKQLPESLNLGDTNSNSSQCKALEILFRVSSKLEKTAQANEYANKLLKMRKADFDKAHKYFETDSGIAPFIAATRFYIETLELVGQNEEAVRLADQVTKAFDRKISNCEDKNFNSYADGEDILFNKFYLLFTRTGNPEKTEYYLRRSEKIREDRGDESIWTQEDLISFLCKHNKPNEALPFIEKLLLADPSAVLDAVDSADHALVGTLDALKKHGMNAEYDSVSTWLYKLAIFELNRQNPHLTRVKFIVDSLAPSAEHEKIRKIVELGCKRFPSGKEFDELQAMTKH